MPVATPTLVPLGEAKAGSGAVPFLLGGGVISLAVGLVLMFAGRKSA
jgi:hypothetical protein